MSRCEFWRAWFGGPGRMVGNPYQRFLANAAEFPGYVEAQLQAGRGVYLSVQPFADRDVVYSIERLFFDFDCRGSPDRARQEASQLASDIRRFYGAEPLVVFSGLKGYHVYVWLAGEKLCRDMRLASDFYKLACEAVTLGRRWETLDRAVFEVKRLSRVPYTPHEKAPSRALCRPVAAEAAKPLELSAKDLEVYRRAGLGDDFVRAIVRKAESARERRQASAGSFTGKPRGGADWIERLLEARLPDGRHRLMWRVVAPYLVTVRRLDVEAAYEVAQAWNERNGSPMRGSYVRAQLRNAKTRRLKPRSLRRVESEWPDVFALLRERGVVG